MYKRATLCVLAVTGAITAVANTAKHPETRTHYVIASRTGATIYHVTVITTATQALGTETYLLKGQDGERIRIDVRRNYQARTVTAEYQFGDDKPVKVKLKLPGRSTSRSAYLRELKANPELRNADVPVTIETARGIVNTSERSSRSRADTARLKDVLGNNVIDATRPLAHILAFPQLGGACSTFSFVSGGETCVASAAYMIAIDRPDCAFDAELGAACDDSQKARARQQPANGKVTSY